jgi:8-oxo-dGTP pyrophosphatase MutT (NUDIX family)
MRDLILERLQGSVPSSDPQDAALTDVHGPISAELSALIQGQPLAAAVLVGLVEESGSLSLLLTERADNLRDHPGQVSFPGGRIEPQDPDPRATALREAHEEIGLAPELVESVGYLDTYLTVTGFIVTPVVGFVTHDFVPQVDETEVREVFQVPLDFLFDPANLRMSLRQRLGATFKVYEYEFQGHRIWGATAAMIVGFRDTLFK